MKSIMIKTNEIKSLGTTSFGISGGKIIFTNFMCYSSGKKLYYFYEVMILSYIRS